MDTAKAITLFTFCKILFLSNKCLNNCVRLAGFTWDTGVSTDKLIAKVSERLLQMVVARVKQTQNNHQTLTGWDQNKYIKKRNKKQISSKPTETETISEFQVLLILSLFSYTLNWSSSDGQALYSVVTDARIIPLTYSSQFLLARNVFQS